MADRQGVDVASYQGPPGQWHGEAGRISWAAVKVTELGPGGSRYVNPDAAADLAWLHDHGKARVFYLFAHPAADPAATVAFFAEEARKIGVWRTDMIMLDHETTDGRTPAEVSAWAQTVLAGLEREFARKPLVYTYPSFAEEGNCAGLEKWPLWISDPNHEAGHPVVPRPWKLWSIHQWSTSAPIDRDLIAWASVADMQAVLGAPRPDTVPAPARPGRRKPARVKTAAVKAVKAPKKAAAAAKKTAVAEPVLTAASGQALLAPAIAWWAKDAGLHWTVTQQHAALVILTAVAGMAAAVFTRPVRVTVFFTALGTAAAAATAFGLHLSPQWLAAEVPAAALLAGGLLRGHVSPAVSAPAAAPAAPEPPPAVPAAPPAAPPAAAPPAPAAAPAAALAPPAPPG